MTTSNTHILKQILHAAQNAAQKGERFGAVFDLDSTLFCVSHRTQSILRKIAHDQNVRQEYPTECEALAQVQVLPTDWGIRTVLIRHQIRSTLAFFELVRQRWAENFFSNMHLNVDQPYPGAVDFVQELQKAGAEIRYLTGRDVHRMGPGTVSSLAQWNFPLNEPGHLHMKPQAKNEDAQFKVEVLRVLLKDYKHLWFFENEPVIINRVQRELPGLNMVLIDSVHSGRESLPDNLPRLLMNFRYDDG